MSPKRPAVQPPGAAKKARSGSQSATATKQADDTDAAPVVVLAGRTEDPEGVGKELVKLLGGNSAAVQNGIRKTDEVPPRYAVPDVIELVKGPGSLSRELSRLRAQYPEVFAKEVDRVRGRYGDRDPNLGDRDPKWISVRFRDSRGRVGANVTPVATLHGILDILVLLPGKCSAELRSQIINVFVRFVGGCLL